MCVLDFGGRSISIATPNISASRPLPVADPNNAAGDAPALQFLSLRAVCKPERDEYGEQNKIER